MPPDKEAPIAQRYHTRTSVPADRGRTGREQRWAVGSALAVGLLVLLAAAPLWWPGGAAGVVGLAALAALALGVATVLSLRRAMRESRATARALDQYSQRLRLSADWHWETDPQMRFSWVSRDLASLVKLGVRPGDLVGHRLDAVPLFEAPEEGWAEVNERLAKHKPLRDLTLEVRRPGRVPVWIALNGRARSDEHGRFGGYEGVGRDVTEQRLAYLKLAESERRHALMAELSVDWYWQTDAEHRIEAFGPVARDLLGDRAAEALGQTRWALHPAGTSESEWAAHRANLEARRPFRGFEYAIRAPGRSLRWVAIGGQPRFHAHGEFIGYHGVGRDITLRKRAERVLISRNQVLERLVAERTAELEQSNRDLEAFSRQLAHELRTPIGQVAGLADLLKSRAWERLAEDEREWLRLQGQAAREMSHTVTALLDLARSASTALVREAVDLSAMVRAVIADLPWIERQDPVEWVIEPRLSAQCSAALVRVVLVNLLGNAAKFTRDVASPRIEFGRDDSLGEGGYRISDNGAGFDAGCASTLFQPFVRLAGSEPFQGSGLGLSIVRRIVERHGGSVAAFGEPGHGARFVFRLDPPRREVQAASDSMLDSTISAIG